MKYVAILETENELSEEVIECTKGTVYVDTSTQFRCTITSIKKAPGQSNLKSMLFKLGYKCALKDCGVIEIEDV